MSGFNWPSSDINGRLYSVSPSIGSIIRDRALTDVWYHFCMFPFTEDEPYGDWNNVLTALQSLHGMNWYDKFTGFIMHNIFIKNVSLTAISLMYEIWVSPFSNNSVFAEKYMHKVANGTLAQNAEHIENILNLAPLNVVLVKLKNTDGTNPLVFVTMQSCRK